MTTKEVYKIERGVENDNIALKKIWLWTDYICCVWDANCTRHLEAITKNGQKVGIQLWLNIREVRLIRIKWNDYIMTRWLIPSFWVVIHEDWKLWTHNYDWLKWKVFILNYDREITSGICDRCYSSSHVATHTWDCFDWGCL